MVSLRALTRGFATQDPFYLTPLGASGQILIASQSKLNICDMGFDLPKRCRIKMTYSSNGNVSGDRGCTKAGP